MRRLAVQTSRNGAEYIRSTIALSLSADGTRLASTHGDHVVRIYNVQKGGFWKPFHADSNVAEAACETWSQFTVELLYELHGHPRTPWSVRFHPRDSDLLVSGCLGGHCYVWQRDHCIARYIVSEQHPEHFAFFPDYGPTSVSCVAFDTTGDVVIIAARRSIFFWHWREAQRQHDAVVAEERRQEPGRASFVRSTSEPESSSETENASHRLRHPMRLTEATRLSATGNQTERCVTGRGAERGHRNPSTVRSGVGTSREMFSAGGMRHRAGASSSRRLHRSASAGRRNLDLSHHDEQSSNTSSIDAAVSTDPIQSSLPESSRPERGRVTHPSISETGTHEYPARPHSSCYFLGMPVHLVDVPSNAGILVVGTRSPVLPAEQEAELFRAAAAPFTLDIQLYRLLTAPVQNATDPMPESHNPDDTKAVHLGALIGKIPQVVAYNEAGISVSADGRHIVVCILHSRGGQEGAFSAAHADENASAGTGARSMHQTRTDSTQHARCSPYTARIVIYEVMMGSLAPHLRSSGAGIASSPQSDERDAFGYFELRERASLPLDATRARALTNLRFVSPLGNASVTETETCDHICFLAGYSFRESMTHFRALREVEPRPLLDLFEADLQHGIVRRLRTIPQDTLDSRSSPNESATGLDFRAFTEVDGVNCALFLPMHGSRCTRLVQGILYGTQRGELYALVH
ncbi:hypothetical protein CCYA_CCYA13G3473 [Cyanidiococcus yangmingshanensis]|nr:hypothetical protein CCYA_CCYA13G3473 [Cyanidiococcus yangmingshanensis]